MKVEIYCLTNVHARTQLVECLMYNMCAHADYKNLLASLLGPTIYPIDPYQPSTPQATLISFLSGKVPQNLCAIPSVTTKYIQKANCQTCRSVEQYLKL